MVFKNPDIFISFEEDFKRYSHHQNNENDLGYRKFLNRLLDPLVQFLPEQFCAIDFGCGPGPTLSSMLKEKGGEVIDYDPIFFNNQEALKKTYDVVTSSEVVEHFKDIENDWSQLVGLVKPNGLLAVMTQFFISSKIDYQEWWYKNDPTHVAFYSEETFFYLAQRFQLEIIFNDLNSVIIFRKKNKRIERKNDYDVCHS